LEKAVLKEIARGSFCARNAGVRRWLTSSMNWLVPPPYVATRPCCCPQLRVVASDWKVRTSTTVEAFL
jgi:hypothetical protein